MLVRFAAAVARPVCAHAARRMASSTASMRTSSAGMTTTMSTASKKTAVPMATLSSGSFTRTFHSALVSRAADEDRLKRGRTLFGQDYTEEIDEVLKGSNMTPEEAEMYVDRVFGNFVEIDGQDQPVLLQQDGNGDVQFNRPSFINASKYDVVPADVRGFDEVDFFARLASDPSGQSIARHADDERALAVDPVLPVDLANQSVEVRALFTGEVGAAVKRMLAGFEAKGLSNDQIERELDTFVNSISDADFNEYVAGYNELTRFADEAIQLYAEEKEVPPADELEEYEEEQEKLLEVIEAEDVAVAGSADYDEDGENLASNGEDDDEYTEEVVEEFEEEEEYDEDEEEDEDFDADERADGGAGGNEDDEVLASFREALADFRETIEEVEQKDLPYKLDPKVRAQVQAEVDRLRETYGIKAELEAPTHIEWMP